MKIGFLNNFFDEIVRYHQINFVKFVNFNFVKIVNFHGFEKLLLKL